jgi:branched-chain amino acid transport system ATP-binding protein
LTLVPPHRLAGRGLKRAFQQNAFLDQLSVLENMVAALQDRHGAGLLSCVLLPPHASRSRRRAIIDAAERLERFGIPAEYHARRPTDIPYGIQRMLSIALAYGSGARVLLLDEPAAGLGGADMARLVDLLSALKREGLALVIIEHHMDLIMTIADRIVVLDQGRMLATGTPREVQEDERVLEAYLGRTS